MFKPFLVSQRDVCHRTWTPRRCGEVLFKKELRFPPAFRLLSKTFILFSVSLSLFPPINFLTACYFSSSWLCGMQLCMQIFGGWPARGESWDCACVCGSCLMNDCEGIQPQITIVKSWWMCWCRCQQIMRKDQNHQFLHQQVDVCGIQNRFQYPCSCFTHTLFIIMILVSQLLSGSG